jgi:hypothetical protein
LGEEVDRRQATADVAVTVTWADFIAVRDQLVLSVSAGELAHYEKVRAAFEGGRDGTARGGHLLGVVSDCPGQSSKSAHQLHSMAIAQLSMP